MRYPFTGCWRLDPSPYGEVRLTVRPLTAGMRHHIAVPTPEGPVQHALDFPKERLAQEGRLLTATLPSTVEHPGGTLTWTVSEDAQTLTVRSAIGPQGEPGALDGTYRRLQVKQVICYRRDLKMRKGKIAAQVAHASMAVFFRQDIGDDEHVQVRLAEPMAVWAKGRFAKVVLSVEDEAALLAVHEAAKEAGLPTALITDAGKTEFKGVPTRTTVAVGPWTADLIDPITGRDGLVATKLA